MTTPRTPVTCVIQARLGSTRLPGKVLMPLAGRSVLDHVVTRVRRAGCFDTVVVATTDRATDDPLAEAAAALGVVVVRGSEDDVLSRFMLALNAAPAPALARVTADCPLIDPGVLAGMARRWAESDADYLTNALERTFPRGLDAEFMTAAALREAAASAEEPAQREHVTPFIYQHPDRFSISTFRDLRDHSSWRWTLDTPEDLALIEHLVQAVGEMDSADYDAFAAAYAAHPEWHAINAHVEQKKVGA